MITRLSEKDIIAIDLSQLKADSTIYTSNVNTATPILDLRYHSAFELPIFTSGHEINNFEIRYDSRPSSHPVKTLPVPFYETQGHIIILYIGVEKGGVTTQLRFFILTSNIIQWFNTLTPQSKSEGSGTKLPWGIWGPSSCWTNYMNPDINRKWSRRNVFGTKYVEFPVGGMEPSTIVFADFNQMKCRKSLAEGETEDVLSAPDLGDSSQTVIHFYKSSECENPPTTTLLWREKRLSSKYITLGSDSSVLICEDAIIVLQFLVR